MPHDPDNPTRPDANASTPYLATAPSVLLDCVRLLAAFAVAVGHLSQNYFTTGWPPVCMDFAHAAVAVFFVLSGFMIRYITRVRLSNFRTYAVDRATRIYSVALPALALTVVFDLVSAHLRPAYYAINFTELGRRGFTPVAAAHALNVDFWLKSLFRVVVSLSMLSQSWFRDSSPLSNSPFWSISYECVFYALFGITIYLRSQRRIAAWIVVFLLIGPTVILMYPLWLLGCASYDAFEQGMLRPAVLANLVSLSVLCVAIVHGLPWLILRSGATWFYFGRAVPTMDIAAIATAFVLPPLCRSLRHLPVFEPDLGVRFIRKAAAATFPLYLIHFPVFVLLEAAVPYPHQAFGAKLALLGAAFALSVLFVAPCDRLKEMLRARLLPWGRKAAMEMPVP